MTGSGPQSGHPSDERLCDETVAGLSRRLADGSVTSQELVRACLSRIASREPEIGAFDHLDPELALRQAQSADAKPRRSALHGVPIGIKDIFDTCDMPTAHGFPPYCGQQSGLDSGCVARLRAAGMVIIGKTVTTEFACPLPRHTRNPHDLSRSPGVSSSGSAAAVAAGMIPCALGSQTGGSVIVPAAFCGVYGFKSSPAAIDRTGYRHCKPSLDSIGLFARSLEDLQLLAPFLLIDGNTFAGELKAPHIGVVRSRRWNAPDADMAAAMLSAWKRLRSIGADLSEIELPDELFDCDALFGRINAWETSIALAVEIRDHAADFNSFNRRKLEALAGVTQDDWLNASRKVADAQAELSGLMRDVDVLILPSAPGEALPFSYGPVPDEFAKFWSLMQLPAVNIPFAKGSHGLPLGLQIIGRRDQDSRLLHAASWIDRHIQADAAARCAS